AEVLGDARGKTRMCGQCCAGALMVGRSGPQVRAPDERDELVARERGTRLVSFVRRHRVTLPPGALRELRTRLQIDQPSTSRACVKSARARAARGTRK